MLFNPKTLVIPYDSKVLVSSNGRYVVTIDSDHRLNRFDRVKEMAAEIKISGIPQKIPTIYPFIIRCCQFSNNKS